MSFSLNSSILILSCKIEVDRTMSKSQAKKYRLKLEREGKRNPETLRGGLSDIDLSTRTTKTKKEKLEQYKHKKRFQHLNGDDGIFFCIIFS